MFRPHIYIVTSKGPTGGTVIHCAFCRRKNAEEYCKQFEKGTRFILIIDIED